MNAPSTSPRSPTSAFPTESSSTTSFTLEKAKIGPTTGNPTNGHVITAEDPLMAMLSHTRQPDTRNDFNSDRKDKKGTHKKTSSLVGFDPLLTSEGLRGHSAKSTKSAGNDNNGVWGAFEYPKDDASNHPLRASVSPTHRNSRTVCTSDLRDIAGQLSIVKPRKNTPNEEEQMQSLITNITLGGSVDDSKLQSTTSNAGRAPRHPTKKSHRKTQSLASVEEYLMSKFKSTSRDQKAGIVSAATTGGRATPPPTTFPSGTGAVSQVPGSVLRTPERTPRLTNSKTITPTRRGSSPDFSSGSVEAPVSSPVPNTAFIPSLSRPSPTSFLKMSNAHALRSSEQEPSLHQLDIPAASEMYLYVRLCQLLEEYHDEDFKNLVGKLPLELKAFVEMGASVPGLVELVHKPVAKLLLELNVTVEGYLVDKHSEVAIFSTSSKIVVVYRGPTNRQAKPVSKKYKHNLTTALDQEHSNVLVFAPFREAYGGLENKVMKMLDRLSDENPFAEVVFTGFSFGAALATTAAARFADSRPMVRFECCVFGTPKVGQLEFRQQVHSLPNLKVMRVEYANDPNGAVPMDSGDCKWYHVGHTIAIHGGVGTGKAPAHSVAAYRFDNHKPKNPLGMKLSLLQQKHTIDPYVVALREFATGNLAWVKRYEGEGTGAGVVGRDNEKRNMV